MIPDQFDDIEFQILDPLNKLTNETQSFIQNFFTPMFNKYGIKSRNPFGTMAGYKLVDEYYRLKDGMEFIMKGQLDTHRQELMDLLVKGNHLDEQSAVGKVLSN